MGADKSGTRLMLGDQVRAENWVLITHGGFYTPAHHDGEGFSTYVFVNCGAKIWAIKEPSLPTPTPTVEELYQAFDDLTGPNKKKYYGVHGVSGTIVLEPGDAL
jgi:hypothetical protein